MRWRLHFLADPESLESGTREGGTLEDPRRTIASGVIINLPESVGQGFISGLFH
jgi:hypothetical protein